MIPLLAAVSLQIAPKITADDAVKRVKRVVEALRHRADGQGAPLDYFEFSKIPNPPKLDQGPSGAMMGRRWEMYFETGKGYGGWAWVDASDGLVRSFHWDIPNYGIQPPLANRKPTDEWLLARAGEYAQAMGITAPLTIERIEPDGNSGNEGCWRVSLIQTYRGIPIGEGDLTIDGRYGLLKDAAFWPSPNPPPSTKPKFDVEKAQTVAMTWVEDAMRKRQKPNDPPFDPARMALLSAPKLVIVRSDESERIIAKHPFNEHAADRIPGVLIYKVVIGVDRFYFEPHKTHFYAHLFELQIEAATGKLLRYNDTTPSMMG